MVGTNFFVIVFLIHLFYYELHDLFDPYIRATKIDKIMEILMSSDYRKFEVRMYFNFSYCLLLLNSGK